MGVAAEEGELDGGWFASLEADLHRRRLYSLLHFPFSSHSRSGTPTAREGKFVGIRKRRRVMCFQNFYIA